jgi:hypothetical protein
LQHLLSFSRDKTIKSLLFSSLNWTVFLWETLLLLVVHDKLLKNTHKTSTLLKILNWEWGIFFSRLNFHFLFHILCYECQKQKARKGKAFPVRFYQIFLSTKNNNNLSFQIHFSFFGLVCSEWEIIKVVMCKKSKYFASDVFPLFHWCIYIFVEDFCIKQRQRQRWKLEQCWHEELRIIYFKI